MPNETVKTYLNNKAEEIAMYLAKEYSLVVDVSILIGKTGKEYEKGSHP